MEVSIQSNFVVTTAGPYNGHMLVMIPKLQNISTQILARGRNTGIRSLESIDNMFSPIG